MIEHIAAWIGALTLQDVLKFLWEHVLITVGIGWIMRPLVGRVAYKYMSEATKGIYERAYHKARGLDYAENPVIDMGQDNYPYGS